MLFNNKIEPPVCPECGKTARLESTKEIYGTDYGKAWICESFPECDNYVGVHKSTNQPLGTMANKELRELRKKCHKSFDFIWRNNYMTRKSAYCKLATEMNIDVSVCHFAMFTKSQCKEALCLIDETLKIISVEERLNNIEKFQTQSVFILSEIIRLLSINQIDSYDLYVAFDKLDNFHNERWLDNE